MQSTDKVAISNEPGESAGAPSPSQVVESVERRRRLERQTEGENETSSQPPSLRWNEERRTTRRRVEAPGEVTHSPRPLTPPHTLITPAGGGTHCNEHRRGAQLRLVEFFHSNSRKWKDASSARPFMAFVLCYSRTFKVDTLRFDNLE